MDDVFIENISFTKFNGIINNNNYYYIDEDNIDDDGKYVSSHTEMLDNKQLIPFETFALLRDTRKFHVHKLHNSNKLSNNRINLY